VEPTVPTPPHYHFFDYEPANEPVPEPSDADVIDTFRAGVHVLVLAIRRDLRESDCVLRMVRHSVLPTALPWLVAESAEADRDMTARFYEVLPCTDPACVR
jgi:hypothetical protein